MAYRVRYLCNPRSSILRMYRQRPLRSHHLSSDEGQPKQKTLMYQYWYTGDTDTALDERTYAMPSNIIWIQESPRIFMHHWIFPEGGWLGWKAPGIGTDKRGFLDAHQHPHRPQRGLRLHHGEGRNFEPKASLPSHMTRKGF